MHLALVAAVLVLATRAVAASNDPTELDGLARYVADHPDNPDIRWTFISKLEAHAQLEHAIAELETFVERWPDRRPEAWIMLGRLRYSRGRYEEALVALEEGLYRDPMTGNGRLYRGLTLRALGRWDEAERELRTAARLEPALEPETLLLRGMERMEAGDEAQARALLERAVALDKSGDTARRAEFLLGDAPSRENAASGQRRFSVSAYSGVEVDTNVTLDSGTSLSPTTSQSDSRALWGATAQWTALQTERSSLTLGLSYSESAHEDLESYDMRSHVGFASVAYRPWDRVSFRLDGMMSDVHLDDERYTRGWSIQPNAMVSLGERIGVSRLWARYDQTRYRNRPLHKALESGGNTYTAGIDHYISIPKLDGAWTSLGFNAHRTHTHNSESGTDPLLDALLPNFRPAFNHTGGDLSARLHLPLLWDFELDLSGSLSKDRYDNRNLIDALTTFGAPHRRTDRVQELGITLTRKLTDTLKAEARWRAIDHRSNTQAYNYTRQIFGFYLRANY